MTRHSKTIARVKFLLGELKAGNLTCDQTKAMMDELYRLEQDYKIHKREDRVPQARLAVLASKAKQLADLGFD